MKYVLTSSIYVLTLCIHTEVRRKLRYLKTINKQITHHMVVQHKINGKTIPNEKPQQGFQTLRRNPLIRLKNVQLKQTRVPDWLAFMQNSNRKIENTII